MSALLSGILVFAQVSVTAYADEAEVVADPVAAVVSGESSIETAPGVPEAEEIIYVMVPETPAAEDTTGNVLPKMTENDSAEAAESTDDTEAAPTEDAETKDAESEDAKAEDTASDDVKSEETVSKDAETKDVEAEEPQDREALEMVVIENNEIKASCVITSDMTQEEIIAAIEAADSDISIEAGDYGNIDLSISGKTVRILAGDSATKFRFIKLDNCVLELENDLSVNSQGTLVDSDKSVFDLVNSTVNGLGNKLDVYCTNSGTVKPNAYAMSVKGNTGVLNEVNLTVSGSNGDRGLLNINSVSFAAYNSVLMVSNNSGLNMWGSAGAPNISVGHDAVCDTRDILFDHCTVNASGATNAYGDGFQINKTADPCTITFDTCQVNFDNNGGNGFMGNPTGDENTKTLVFINSNVSASGNGQGKKGASIGIANANIQLINNDGEMGAYELNVSNNYKLGIAANGSLLPGNNTSITADGYKITANGNGVEDGVSGCYGYGIYLGRDGSSFTNCIIDAEKNGKDGLTIGGNTAVTIDGCDVRTVQNGGNGLVTNVETIWTDTEILSSCNGTIKGDEVDTTANKAVTFEGCTGGIGKAVIDENSTADAASKVLADCENENQAVTEGDTLYLFDADGNVIETTEGAHSHHHFDWDKAELVSDPTDDEYGRLRVDCNVCGKDSDYVPLVRVVYDKNTDDEVTQMPEDSTDLLYGSNISVDGTPVRQGYTFTGWYLDAAAQEEASADMQGKTPTLRLYAGWEEDVTPAPGPNPNPNPAPAPEPVPDPDPAPLPNPTPAEEQTVVPIATNDVTEEAETNPVTLADAETPLASNVLSQDEETPLTKGELDEGGSWALVNFALMNLAIFECLMLLIGYFIKTKNGEEEEEDDKRSKKLKKKGIVRLISIPVGVISAIAFVLTEDITNPIGFVDRYTILMAVIVVVQTVLVALSRKKYEKEDEKQEETANAAK